MISLNSLGKKVTQRLSELVALGHKASAKDSIGLFEKFIPNDSFISVDWADQRQLSTVVSGYLHLRDILKREIERLNLKNF